MVQEKKGKRNYVTTATETKRKLITMVFGEECATIKEAANRLNINYSTAKHIAKTYKQETNYH